MKKNSVKRRIIVSFMLIGGLFLLVFASVVAYTVLDNGKKDVNEYLTRNNENLFNVTNLLLDSVYVSMHDFYSNDVNTIKALHAMSLDDFERREVHVNLNRMVHSSPILDSIYIYNKNQNMVFSSLSVPKPLEEFYEVGLIDLLNEEKADGSAFIAREISLKDVTLYYDTDVITFVFTDSGYINEGTSMMVVNISQSKLNRIIYQDMSESETMSSFFVDNDGKLISYSDKEFVDAVRHETSFTDRIINSNQKTGNFNTSLMDQVYMVSYIKSSKLGFTFISLDAYDQLFTEVYNMLKLIGLITALFSLISTVCALYIANSIYKPIGKLVQEVSSFDTLLGNKYSNEYDFILNSIENMQAEIGSLEEEVSSYIPAMTNTLLKRLLTGHTVDREVLESNGIVFNDPIYAVIVFRLDAYSSLSKNIQVKDLLIYRNKLIQLAIEFLSDKFQVYTVEDGLEFVPAIISIPNGRISWLAEVQQQVKEMQHRFELDYGLTFNTGIGNIAFSTLELKDSYVDAVEVTNYRIIYGNNAIITNQDIREAKRCDYVYPLSIEKKILDTLKLMKKDKLEALMGEFTASVRGFEYNEILQSYSQLVLVIVRTARQVNYTTNKGLRVNYIEMQNKLNSCITIEDINEVILKLMTGIVNRQEKVQESKHHELIERIKAYIKEHYEDEELCIEQLAENEHFSVNYLRSLFKCEVGISLSDYVNQVRFEKAKVLLLETKYSAKKVASMCGFSSNDYFYYAFKKFTGQSPTLFRKENA